VDSETTIESERMTEPDITRFHPRFSCNKCKNFFSPYGEHAWAPIMDVVSCPTCGEKRILYYGNDAPTMKMILSTYGVNKDLNERLDKLESQIITLKDAVITSLSDAKNIMTETLISALKEQIGQHEKEYHNVNSKYKH
jgi:hypothetical protein